jgi:hypothetical protein
MPTSVQSVVLKKQKTAAKTPTKETVGQSQLAKEKPHSHHLLLKLLQKKQSFIWEEFYFCWKEK